jgi:hypothetical protein
MTDEWATEAFDIPEHMQELPKLLVEVQALMFERGRKYGPGNIAEFGEFGVLVRMSDKFARLRNGFQHFDDESLRDTVLDVVGYGLIWLMLLDGNWPASQTRKLAEPPF